VSGGAALVVSRAGTFGPAALAIATASLDCPSGVYMNAIPVSSGR